MQRIICELSNLSKTLKDTKANQNTRSKNPTTSLQLAVHFSFSPLSFLPNLETSFIWSTSRNFRRLSFPPLILSVYRLFGGGEIDLGPNNHGFKKISLYSLWFLYIQDAYGHLVISILPIRSRRPWSSCEFLVSL